jgi:hypothetical protein
VVTLSRTVCADCSARLCYQPPVLLCGAATGFDWEVLLCLRQCESPIIAPIARNWLCQFWNDSNQKRGAARNWSAETGHAPCSTYSWLYKLAHQ